MFTTNMFNSSLDMIMASDRNNLITQVNNAVLKIFGYNYQEIISKCLTPILSRVAFKDLIISSIPRSRQAQSVNFMSEIN